jgi:hypothetical protein
MGGMHVFRRITVLIVGGVIASAALVVAQAPPPPPQQPLPAPAPATPEIVNSSIKSQVETYEFVLQRALDKAQMKLANWASDISPGVLLVRAAAPSVSSVYLPDNSIAFNIDIAEILPASVQLLNRFQKDPSPSSGNSGKAVNAAGGLVNPDPVVPPTKSAPAPATPSGVPLNPNQQYSDFVREALIDALVDEGWITPVIAGQWLTVQVTPRDVAVQNMLYRNQSRRLILSIRGDDLDKLRNKTLTRDEALKRVVDRRF